MDRPGREHVGAGLPGFAGLAGRGRLHQRVVAHRGLALRLAVDRPRRAVVVRPAFLGPGVVVRQDAKAQLGILVETKSGRTVVVKPNPEATFRLEEIPKEGMKLCYSRTTAMVREDADFLTWDHPLVFRATDRLLATAIGNTAYVVWEDERAQIVLLEGIFLATPGPADPKLHTSRHMPPTPVRVVISHDFEDMSGEYTSEMVNKIVRNGRREWLRNNARPLYNIIPSMMRILTQRAAVKMRELAGKASHQMEAMFAADITRLKRLPSTTRRDGEIARLGALIATLKPLIGEPILSLDQLRLLRRGPSGKGI